MKRIATMSPITTHVLDLASGRPAKGVPVTLEFRSGKKAWRVLGRGKTDADGRLKNLLTSSHRLKAGVYRLHFDLAVYSRGAARGCFFPEAAVVFTVKDTARHYHMPLLLSPYGYSTYRGS